MINDVRQVIQYTLNMKISQSDNSFGVHTGPADAPALTIENPDGYWHHRLQERKKKVRKRQSM